MKRKVIVTQEHIDNSEPKSSCLCPLALVFRDMGYPQVAVYETSFSLFDGTFSGPHHLSRRARQFVKRFDSGNNPAPATFMLDFPLLKESA